MRRKLKAVGTDERHTFTAEFVRYGYKMSYMNTPVRTLLFQNIKNEKGKVVAGHIWFTTTKEFAKFDFRRGNIIQFDARVTEYIKGYRGRKHNNGKKKQKVSVDYKLSRPTKIKEIRDI